ncbi:MAG TPA: hypothetical protein VFK54_00150 [Candidatus Limnocylindrales bacterium]|nr:hypothetical protein [Candidatus Limnocylindrales bacterium]
MTDRASDRNDAGGPRPEPVGQEDPGAYIGREPERATETIPGGVGPGDERVAAVATQGTGVGRPDERGQPADEPSGHRFGDSVSDDDVRRAGDGPG